MRIGPRKALAAAAGLVATGVLVAVAWLGTLEALIVVATVTLLVAVSALGWLVVRAERRVLRAVRDARPVVQQEVRRIEVVQPEAHLEQLVRTIGANTARLEEGQADLRERLDRLTDG